MSPGFFRGRVAIVGETAPSLQDLHSTPVDPFMSGPEVQANAIYTALRGFPLESVPGWINICLIVLSALVPVLAARRSAGIMAAATLLAAVILVVAAQFAFEAGWVVAVVYPLGTLVIAAYGALSHRLHYASVDREHELDRFKRPRAPLSHGHRAE